MKRLYEEQKNQLEQDMAPFGFIVDGTDDEQFVDKEGDRWFIDNGSMDTSASPSAWNADEYGDKSYNWEYR